MCTGEVFVPGCSYESVNSAVIVRVTFWLRTSHSEITLGSPGCMDTIDHIPG